MGGRLEEPAGKYEYYRLGTSVPIRVSFDLEGRKMGAEVPDEQTGTLAKKASYLSIVETSPDAERISREEFEALCKDVWHRRV